MGMRCRRAAGRDAEVFMFETPEEVKQKEPKGFWIGIIVVVIIVTTGTLFYVKYRGGAQRTTAASAAAQAKGPADPVHNLKVLRATNHKDRTCTTSLLLETIADE